MKGKEHIPRQKVQLYGICEDTVTEGSKTILRPVWLAHGESMALYVMLAMDVGRLI